MWFFKAKASSSVDAYGSRSSEEGKLAAFRSHSAEVLSRHDAVQRRSPKQLLESHVLPIVGATSGYEPILLFGTYDPTLVSWVAGTLFKHSYIPRLILYSLNLKTHFLSCFLGDRPASKH